MGDGEEAGVSDFNGSGDAVLTGLDFPEVDGPLADGDESVRILPSDCQPS